ncbi:MAG: GlsB/YeaQ/YmgE family stress response membrane protein [Anaerolineae bacterium]|nr:GlsB/YeaQ/YmgE family stress response membrane protein [Anaerolineae bacterium]
MTTINILAWGVLGAIIGLVFALVRKNEAVMNVLPELLIGIIGGFLGGVILNALGGIVGSELAGVNLGGAIVAIVGAVVLVAVLEMLRGTPQQ